MLLSVFFCYTYIIAPLVKGKSEESVKKLVRADTSNRRPHAYSLQWRAPVPPDSASLFRITDPLDQAQPPEAPRNPVGERQLDHGHGGSKDDCLYQRIVEDCDIQHAFGFGIEKDAGPGEASKPQGDSQSAKRVGHSFCLHTPHELVF